MAKQNNTVFELENQDKTKVCTKCNKELPATVEFFYKLKSCKYGLHSQCKECIKKYREDNNDRIKARQKEYRKNNKDKLKKYLELNKAKKDLYNKNYNKKNKDKIKLHQKKYYENNKEKVKLKSIIYYQNNKDQYRKYNKLHRQNNKEYIKKRTLNYLKSHAEYDSYKNNKTLLLVEQIRKDPIDNKLLQVKCAYCGKWINITKRQVLSRINTIEGKATGECRFYCNDNNNACRDSCPIFHKKKYPAGFRKATSREVAPELRQMCFERDSWECQKCGASIQEDTLHCHHIKGYTQNKILANDIDNVITLCKECHKEIHSQEGCKYHELQCHNE